MSYKNIREEELKNKIAKAYFGIYDATKIIGDIDFCISINNDNKPSEYQSMLWAEAKKETADIT